MQFAQRCGIVGVGIEVQPSYGGELDPSTFVPTIHEAELESGASGVVIAGPELTEDLAVARRRAGHDVVVQGPAGPIDAATARAIKALARRIEEAVGLCFAELAHLRHAGRQALPHFHQRDRSPGHTFYEDSSGRRARRRP